MSDINKKAILKAIDRKVCVENKIVCSKDLMNEFRVNIVFIDRLMNEYITKCRDKEIPIKVTYLLSGYNNDPNRPDDIKFHRFIIVDEDELEERKKYFTELTGCQVRTIESAENDEKFNESFIELPYIDDIETVKGLQKLTLISNENIEIRENRVKYFGLTEEPKKSDDLTAIKTNNKAIDNDAKEKITNSNDDNKDTLTKSVKKALNNKKESIKNMFTRIEKCKDEKEISVTNDCIEKEEEEENNRKDSRKANKNQDDNDDECIKIEVDLDKKKSEKIINDRDNCDYAKHDKMSRKVNKRKSSELTKNSKKVKQNDKSNKKRKRIRFMASDSESDEKDEEDSDKEDEQEEDDGEDERMSQSDNEVDKASEADDNSDDERQAKEIIAKKNRNATENPSNGTAWVLQNVDETAVDEDGYLVTKKRKKIVEVKVDEKEEKAKVNEEKKKKKQNNSPPEPSVARPKKGKLAAGQASIMSFFKPAVKT